MYNSSDPPGGERVGLGGEEGSSNGGERAPPPTGNLDITRALEDTANVLTAPDKVGCVGKRDVNKELERYRVSQQVSDFGWVEFEQALTQPLSFYRGTNAAKLEIR